LSTLLLQQGITLIDRYRVDEYIAEGGMQQVFRAYDLAFGRSVALKVPKNPSAEKRFARSARVSARITHANVAKTLDYFEDDGKSYLIEELIAGQDLGKKLKEEYELLDPHLAAHVLHLLVKGVAASHHAGVVHRDLKPSNIMVGDDANLSTLKVTDFGIAKMAEQELLEAVEGGENSISASSTALGALPYMAPEMINQPKRAGQPADIWSLGAMLYRLLSGVLPFGAGLRAVNKITLGPPPGKPPILETKPQFASLCDSLWTVIQACLTKEQDKRPTADQLIETCGNVCYSDAQRRFGTISSYRPSGKGKWGLIEADDGAQVFYHADSYYGGDPVVGARVSFACFPGQPYARAFPVLPLRVAETQSA